MAAGPELAEVEEEEDWGMPVPPEYMRDSEWISAHIDELTEQYPDQWISVVDGQVIAASKDGGLVQRKTREETGRRQFPMWLCQTGHWPWRWPR